MRHLSRTRTFTSIVIIVLVILLAFVFSLTFATKYYVSVQRQSMIDLYGSICEIYGDTADNSIYSEEKREEMDLVCESAQVSLCIMDSSGSVVFSYGDSYVLIGRLEEIIFGGNSSATSVYVEDDDYVVQNASDGDVKYVEMWGFLDNGFSFIARTSFSGIQNSITITMRFFAIVSGIVLFAIVAMLIGVNISYIKSLKFIIRAAQETNEGNFEYKYQSRGRKNDELDILGDNLSQLAEKLEKTISELKTSNLNLENELKAKTELEEARKKYLSDVSHELKTPLALISGYAEGLKEGIGQTQEDRDYYLDVIIDEAEKMNVIIKRLATLNQLEQGQSAVLLERFNLTEAIDGFLNTMSILLEEKEIKVYFDNRTSVYVWTDEFLFEEVFINYINNALNHVDENRTIRISVEFTDEKTIRVTVFNTGKNIPEEEIDKIWDKFYKVDKARTRAYGGSGLGLSIVKAVADSLGKECGVYNREDGVAFWIDLEAASTPDTVMTAEKIEKTKLIDIPRWINSRKEDAADAEYEVLPGKSRTSEYEAMSENIREKASFTVPEEESADEGQQPADEENPESEAKKDPETADQENQQT